MSDGSCSVFAKDAEPRRFLLPYSAPSGSYPVAFIVRFEPCGRRRHGRGVCPASSSPAHPNGVIRRRSVGRPTAAGFSLFLRTLISVVSWILLTMWFFASSGLGLFFVFLQLVRLCTAELQHATSFLWVRAVQLARDPHHRRKIRCPPAPLPPACCMHCGVMTPSIWSVFRTH